METRFLGNVLGGRSCFERPPRKKTHLNGFRERDERHRHHPRRPFPPLLFLTAVEEGLHQLTDARHLLL